MFRRRKSEREKKGAEWRRLRPERHVGGAGEGEDQKGEVKEQIEEGVEKQKTGPGGHEEEGKASKGGGKGGGGKGGGKVGEVGGKEGGVGGKGGVKEKGWRKLGGNMNEAEEDVGEDDKDEKEGMGRLRTKKDQETKNGILGCEESYCRTY